MWGVKNSSGKIVAVASEKENLDTHESKGKIVDMPKVRAIARLGGTLTTTGKYREPSIPQAVKDNTAAIRLLKAKGQAITKDQMFELIRRERFGG